MTRAIGVIVVLAIVVAACTSSETANTTSTTTATPSAPVTTLAPADGSISTTTASTAPTTTSTTEPPAHNECVVESDLSVDGYTKGCTVLGIRMLTTDEVDDAALLGQSDRVYNMLVSRPDLLSSVTETDLQGRVIPSETRITDLSEYSDLYNQYPGTDWARRGRSFPGTEALPIFAGAEENLLCSADDFYEGEDNFVRTFALTVRRFALDIVDEGTASAIDQAYGQAIAQGLWKNTLAEINQDEYWMEGTQSFFDANLENNEEEREPNSSHNHVDTREELRDYDPALWSIAASVYGETEWRPACP